MSGLSSADKAALYGNDGYGPGMTGAQTGAYDSILGATGSKGLADLFANDGFAFASLGAGLGALQGSGTQTSTKSWPIDPRMAQYLYGTGYGDPNSLLGAAQGWWQQNKTGLNPTMQQGLDMQRAALTDPAYGQAYTQMRDVGSSLLAAPVAGNPFTSGGLLSQPNVQAGGGLVGPRDRAKALITRGGGLLGS